MTDKRERPFDRVTKLVERVRKRPAVAATDAQLRIIEHALVAVPAAISRAMPHREVRILSAAALEALLLTFAADLLAEQVVQVAKDDQDRRQQA